MFGSGILEVIVGMIFVFSLFSILVTQINTVISNALRLRARHLRNGIADLVTDPEVQAKILTHPLVRLVRDQPVLPNQILNDEQAEAINKGKVNDVSWIAPKTFVTVLMSIIRVDQDQELFGALLNVVDEMPPGAERRTLRLQLNRIIRTGEGLDDLRETIDTLSLGSYRDALSKALDRIDDEIGRLGLQSDSVISLMAGLRSIKNPYLEAALETILSTSRTIADAEAQLEEWFNEGMDRASRNFTKHMQRYSLVIGLVLAVLVNADSLHIARTLWEDPTLRAAVNLAAETASQNIQLPETTIGDATEGTLPSEETTDTIEEAQDRLEAFSEVLLTTQGTIDQLLELRLPLGWYFEDNTASAEAMAIANENPDDTVVSAEIAIDELLLSDSRNLWNILALGINPNSLGLLVTKFIGFGITAIAIAQGAPFWFNILRRVTGRD